jgi:hypothetical protein
MKRETKLKLAAVLLEMASDQFANHGCNDFDLSVVVPDEEERRQLVKEYQEFDNWPECDRHCSDDAKYDLGDSTLMQWLSDVLHKDIPIGPTDKHLAPDISDNAWDAAHTILCCWGDWDESAGQDAQASQSSDAYLDAMQWQIATVVQGAIEEAGKQNTGA